MRTTIDDIPQLGTLGPAEPVVAPSNVFSGADTIWAVLYAAFRDAMADGREPHGVMVRLAKGTDIEALVPADAEIVRSAVDDEDVALLAKGLGFTVLLSSAGPIALVSAVSREQAQAVAASLPEQVHAPAPAPEHEPPPPGQYL
jgi:Domain of unknown function (DUF5925)